MGKVSHWQTWLCNAAGLAFFLRGWPKIHICGVELLRLIRSFGPILSAFVTLRLRKIIGSDT